jgi:hypothetical protein
MLSLSEHISFWVTGDRKQKSDHAKDRLIVERYVIGKTIVVAVLLSLRTAYLSCLVQVAVWYVLVEMYVQLLTIVFVGTLLLALSGHSASSYECPLLRVKQTSS